MVSGIAKGTRLGHGTDGNRAPELLEDAYDERHRLMAGKFNRKSDIWAIGCVLFELATTGRKQAFSSDIKAYLYSKDNLPLPQIEPFHNPNLAQNISLPDGRVASPRAELNDIIKICFAPLTKNRPSAQELYVRFQDLMNRFQKHP